MGLLSPAQRECHAHVTFPDSPVPHLYAVNFHDRHKVRESSSEFRIDARVSRRVDVDLHPTGALVGTNLEHDVARFMAQMTTSTRIENDSWLHTATLGPW